VIAFAVEIDFPDLTFLDFHILKEFHQHQETVIKSMVTKQQLLVRSRLTMVLTTIVPITLLRRFLQMEKNILFLFK
jgi:hypothetical protein